MFYTYLDNFVLFVAVPAAVDFSCGGRTSPSLWRDLTREHLGQPYAEHLPTAHTQSTSFCTSVPYRQECTRGLRDRYQHDTETSILRLRPRRSSIRPRRNWDRDRSFLDRGQDGDVHRSRDRVCGLRWHLVEFALLKVQVVLCLCYLTLRPTICSDV